MQHDLIVPSNQEPQSSLKDSNSNSGIKLKSYESQNNSNIYTPCVASNNKCPPHISRHDGEFGRDQFSSYQVTVSTLLFFISQNYNKHKT